ncbi:MAG: alpha/beta hydrolase [Bacteroidetes bacterium]|nr:alpha/beta hydrolase [Bacteroidota bacterium]
MKKIIIICVAILCSINTYALKPDSVYVYTPSLLGVMYKEFSIYTKDNFRLNAWFYPAQEALSKDSINVYFKKNYDKKNKIFKENLKREYKADTVKKPTIIISNGDAANMYQLMSLAYVFITKGFNVLTFDWRGFGKSQYFPVDTNYMVYEEFITDYQSAINAVKIQAGVDTTKIGVFGFSTGAQLSFIISALRPEIKAYAGRALFTSDKEVIPNLKKIKPNDTYFVPKDFDKKYAPIILAENYHTPIFLIVGENDKRTPPLMSIKILNTVKSNVRELWIVKNASHGGEEAPEIVAYEEFKKKIVRFFNENL